DLHVARRGHADVRGLHVAMHHAVRVRVAEPFAELAQQVELPLDRERHVLDHALEVAARHELHRQEQSAAALADVVDLDDVAVAQPARRLRLAQEALAQVVLARELRRQHLDRDATLQHRIAGLVDGAHRAGAEEPQHLVFPDARRGLVHPEAGILSGARSAIVRASTVSESSVVGLGVDLVETSRVRTALARWGGRLVAKLMAPEEAALLPQEPIARAAALARAIAAKEAASKALG